MVSTNAGGGRPARTEARRQACPWPSAWSSSSVRAADPAWRAPRLTTLEMRVPGTRATAHIDFKPSVVRATDSMPIRTFALICARHVAGLDEAEVADLAAKLDGPAGFAA